MLQTQNVSFLGQEHRQHYSETLVPGRQLREEDCIHRCQNKLSLEEKDYILEKFNNIGNHEVQNIYLQNCTIPRENNRFDYLIHLTNRTEVVCQKNFVATHGIKRSRLQRKVLQ